ncbi:MAG: C25 family cysteine peptidase [Bacteroidales bacterium]|jgi:hypothetical protein|nr:C25 family cysteine peptidase [Bacteroidales bacterium]
MKKIILLSIFLASLALNLFSQEIRLEFDYPDIINNGEYIELIYEDLHEITMPGNPIIPFMHYSILEEQDRASVGITITDIEYYDNVVEGKLLPAATPVPISSENKTINIVENDEIYLSNSKYPSININATKTHYLGGYGITSLSIYAAEYYPADGVIKLIKSITFKNNSKDKKSEFQANNKIQTITRINNLVNNNSALKSYSYNNVKSNDEVDVLFITSSEYASQLDEYSVFKNKFGYYTAIETTENIYQKYSGVDNQDKIRNCVKDYYDNKSLQYLILVGDADTKNESENIIPCRGFAALDDPCIPADMYYSNLNGTWNENNNDLWGEPDEIDYYAEVSVGRLCIDSHDELNNFINKLMLYQDRPVVDDIEKALMVGESLDSYTWGGNYKDEIVAGTYNHGFYSAGIPENIEISRLYERDKNWGLADIKKAYNEKGVNMLNHLGHSNVDYNMKIGNASLTTNNFTNDGISRSFVIHYSQGCYNGSMDNRNTGENSYGTTDCFAEIISTLPTANVACIANSRYGWYMPGGTNSSSQFYDRLFYDGIYNANYPKVGDANRYSKEKYTSWLNESGYFRWTAYEVNLFGDPSMEVWTQKPTEITVNISNIIFPDENLQFVCNTAFARIALMKDNTLIYRTTSDENGLVNINLSSLNLDVNDVLELHITAHNRFHYFQNLKVVNNSFKFSIENSFSDILGNNDGIINHGEEILINLTIENIGLIAAPELNATILCNNQYILLITNEITIPALQPGETTLIENIKYIVDVDAMTSECLFYLKFENDINNSFYSTIVAPLISLNSYEVSEKTGNNNGKLEPGEEGRLKLVYINYGNYPAKNVVVTVEPCDIYVTVSEQSVVISELSVGESFTVEFDFTVDSECPESFVSYFETKFTDEMDKVLVEKCITYIGSTSILIIDLDGNNNSMPKLKEDIFKLSGAQCPYVTTMPTINELSNYSLIFLSLGIYPENFVLTQAYQKILIEYLENGGRLYLESGSFWDFDKNYGLFEYFNVIGDKNEESWLKGFTNIVGVEGSFTEDLIFSYNGDNLRIDYQTATAPAFQIFNNSPVEFGGATAYDAGTYKVIGSSFEYGGLEGDVNSLLEKYLEFFDTPLIIPTAIPFGNDTTVCRQSEFNLDGGDGFIQYKWSTGNTDRYLSLDMSLFEGNYVVIELEAIDEKGYIVKKSIKINIDNCAGIFDYNQFDISIYPNPATNQVFISFNSDNENYKIELQVYNLNGSLVHKQNINNMTSVDISRFNKGVYMFKVITPKNVITKKIIKE